MKRITPVLVLAASLVFASCEKGRVFEKNIPLKGYSWGWDNRLVYEVEVPDTAARYDLLINIRHRADYPFVNLWVNIYTTYPSGKTGKLLYQVGLGDNEGQKWLG